MSQITIKFGRKGFTVSPFFLIALILIGALLVSHFQRTDETKYNQMIEQGAKDKTYLNDEEKIAELQSLLTFVSYQAVFEENAEVQKQIKDAQDKGLDPFTVVTDDIIKADLEKKIETYLNKESKNTFKVSLDNSKPTEGFVVNATGGTIKSSTGKNIPVALEKFMNTRIFFLNSKLSTLQSDFMDPLKKKMECKFKGGAEADSASCAVANLPIGDKGLTALGVECTITAKEHYVISSRLKSTGEIMQNRIYAGLLEVEKELAIESNKNKDDLVSSYQIKSIDVAIKPIALNAFDDVEANKYPWYPHCCKNKWIPPVRDSKTKKIITPGYFVCLVPDKDYSGSTDITAEIKIQANFSDHAKIADNGYNNFRICTTSPVMTKTGSIVPLQLSYEFTVPVVIHFVYPYTECSFYQPKALSESKTRGFPVYFLDATTQPYTPNQVTCGTNIKTPKTDCRNALQKDISCGCGK